MSNLDRLRNLMQSGEFHHATYRCLGTLWEGLWIYRHSPEGFRGYDVAFSIPKNHPDLDVAMDLVRATGISVGSYGQG